MKKLISSVISLSIAACAALPTAVAADSDYVPTLYFRSNAAKCVSVCPSGNAVVFRSELGVSSDISVNASVYIDDESLSCWNVHPVWKCASGYARLENLVDPLPMSDDAPNIAYAYAETEYLVLCERAVLYHCVAGLDYVLDDVLACCSLINYHA